MLIFLLSQILLTQSLLSGGFPAPAPGPDAAGAAFTRALTQAVKAAAPATWSITITGHSSEPWPVGTLHFDPRGLPGGPRRAKVSPVLWRGVRAAPGGRRYPVWVRAVITEARPAWRLRQGVKVRTLIEAANLESVTLADYPLWPPPLATAGGAAGARARRTLAAGHILLDADFSAPPAVARGESLAVTVAAGQTRLQLLARAEADARVGDIVLVKNPLNGRRFAARVTRPGAAEAEIHIP